MNKYVKKLRQTTLQFKSMTSCMKKRKMDSATNSCVHNAVKKSKADDRDDSMQHDAIEETSRPESQTSKYFDKKENNDSPGSEEKVDLLVEKPSSPEPTKQGATGTLVYSLSPDLFDNSESLEDSPDAEELQIPSKKPSLLKRESSWRGIKLSSLKTAPTCLGEVNPLSKSTKQHTVLIKVPNNFSAVGTSLPTPYPSSFTDKWDHDHVRMPCSTQNEYPVEAKDGKTVLTRRWELIEEALNEKIIGPFELEEAILTYNQRYANKWNFTALKYFFLDFMKKEDKVKFFTTTLPKMAKLALQMGHLCTQSIPLLKQHRQHSITLSQQQAACLLANAFFCTYPRRNAKQRHAEYANYPDINFNILFQGPPNKRKIQKLQCIVHYFERVTSEMPRGTLTFERKMVEKSPNWEDLGTEFSQLYVSSAGTIEDNGKGMLQVDFANKYVGGGVLGNGCVQEEIRFLICPEMILSRLFTEVLDKNESLVMTGCEQFSSYEGYADTFTWSGPFYDTTPRDFNGRLHVEVVAIDALIIRGFKKQFQKWFVERELNKAYSGFNTPDVRADQLSAVCTGNWGCGAFGGDKRLKALIQLMAASLSKRDVCYFTFGDDKLTDDLYKIHQFISKENGLSVGNVMQLISQYNRNMCQNTWWGKPKRTIFEYIIAVFDGTLDSDSTVDEFGASSPETNIDWEEAEEKNTLKHEDSDDYKANTP